MATAIISGDVIQLRVICKDETGGENINVYHFGLSAPTGGITDHDVADAFDTYVAAAYKAAMCDSSFYDGVEASIINRTPKPSTVYYNGSLGSGTAGSVGMAGQVAGMISWATAFAGKAFRGRTYIPNAPSTAKNATGFPTSAYVALVDAIASAVLSATTFAVAGGKSCSASYILWHRKLLGFNLILSFDLPFKFGTQRRRGNYGRNRTPPI